MINRSQKLNFKNSYRLLGITKHLKTQPHHVPIKNSFYYPFRPLFDRRAIERNRVVENGSKMLIKAVFCQQMHKTILLECSVILNYQFQIVGDEFVTSIGHDDELFYVNLHFYRFIHRPMCKHMGHIVFVPSLRGFYFFVPFFSRS